MRFRSMTSHKKRLWHEARIRTTLKGPRSSWKSSVMNSCHWEVCDFKASKQSTSSSEMDFRKIAWRSSLVTSRWTSYGFFLYFCEPFFRFLGGGRRPQFGPSTFLNPKLAQDGPKMAPDSFKMAFKTIKNRTENRCFCSWIVFGPQAASAWPKMVPRWPNMGPKQPQHGPRWSRYGPTWPQDGSEMDQHGPKMAPRWPQDGPKMAPRGPKMASSGPRIPQR